MRNYRQSLFQIFKLTVAVFVMASAFLTTSPTRIQATEVVSGTFKDIKKSDFFYESVLDLNSRGIIDGFKDGTFQAEKPVTRGQTAKILSLTLGLDTKKVKNPGYIDVKSTDQFYEHISALADAGVINGYKDKTFRANNILTRAEMAAIIHSAFALKKEKLKETHFKDVPIDSWYGDYVQSLITHGITKGLTPTEFGPSSVVTRGQIASFVTRSEASAKPVHATVTTLAGNGAFTKVDSKNTLASFRTPQSLVSLADGSVLVSDGRNQLIRKIQNGNVTTFAGMTLDSNEQGLPQGGMHNSDKETSFFNGPSGMVADSKGNIFLADSNNHVIRKIGLNGQVTTVAGEGFIGNQDGGSSLARFNSPQDIAVAMDGTIYVADTLNHVIRKISVSGEVSTLNASSNRAAEVVEGSIESAGDFKDGRLVDAKFNEPSGLVMDAKGNLYVSDTGNHLIRYIDLSNNTVTTVAGDLEKGENVGDSTDLYAAGGYADGPALASQFNFPKGLAITKEGGVLIADSLNHTIRYLIRGKVITIAGNPQENGYVDGEFRQNLFNYPTDVAIKQDGSILVADSHNNRVREIKLDRIVFPKTRSISNTNNREAEIGEITGTVFITKAGGIKSFRAVSGMKVQHGDRIETEEYSSLTLKVLDTGDVITIGEKAELLLSELRYETTMNITNLTVLSGSVWAKVTPLVKSKDVFTIHTSAATMDVRGTNLMVGVDPNTGESQFFIASGQGKVTKKGNENIPGVTVLPAQQITIADDTNVDILDNYLNVVNMETLVSNTGPEVIKAIVTNKQAIDKENEDYIKNLKEQQNPPNQQMIDRISQNLDNLVGNLVKSGVNQNKVDKNKIQSLIDQVNSQLDKKLDLNHVKPLELSEAEKAKQAQIKLLEEQRKKKQEAEKLKQEELKNQNAALQQKLKEQLEKQKAEKQIAAEAAKKKAEEEFKKQLSNAAKLAFETKLKEMEEEKRKQITTAAAEKARVETPVLIPPIVAPAPAPDNSVIINQNLANAKARIPSDNNLSVYMEASVLILTEALDLPENNNIEKVLKTEAINNALEGLVLELGAFIRDGDLSHNSARITWESINEEWTYQVILNGEVQPIEGAEGTAIINGLIPGTSYQVEIRAINSEGITKASSILNYVTHMDELEFAMEFNGTSDYISIPHHDLFNSDSITIEAWILPKELKDLAGIVSKYHLPQEEGFTLRLSEITGKYINFQTSSNHEVTSNANHPLIINEWVHVAVVFEKGTSKIYLNSSLRGESGSGTLLTNYSDIHIGRDYETRSRFFKGYIDDVRIWNTTKTAGELELLMHAELNGDEEGLIASWTFEQESDLTALDQTSNNFNGTIHGATRVEVNRARVPQ